MSGKTFQVEIPTRGVQFVWVKADTKSEALAKANAVYNDGEPSKDVEAVEYQGTHTGKPRNAEEV